MITRGGRERFRRAGPSVPGVQPQSRSYRSCARGARIEEPDEHFAPRQPVGGRVRAHAFGERSFTVYVSIGESWIVWLAEGAASRSGKRSQSIDRRLGSIP